MLNSKNLLAVSKFNSLSFLTVNMFEQMTYSAGTELKFQSPQDHDEFTCKIGIMIRFGP